MKNNKKRRDAEFAAIFDMNGTIVNDAKYNFEAWKILCAKRGYNLSYKGFKQHIAGHNRDDIISYLFGADLPKEIVKEYLEEKGRIYIENFGPVLREIKGLTNLLEELHSYDIPIILATSGSKESIDFILGKLNLFRFFDDILQSKEVAKGKPAPDIYLKAAQLALKEPENCAAFEDSTAGLKSAKAAGMKCVGLATSLSVEDLISSGADLAIKDFSGINYQSIQKLFR